MLFVCKWLRLRQVDTTRIEEFIDAGDREGAAELVAEAAQEVYDSLGVSDSTWSANGSFLVLTLVATESETTVAA